MKSRRDTRYVVAALLLGAALVVGIIAVGCFGGGDDAEDVTTSGADGAASTSTTSVDEGTTLMSDANSLSSFKSKDPFIQQAQLVTTTAPPTTVAPATTASTATTVRVTTTTVVHSLTVTGFPGGGLVSFKVDSEIFTGFGEGPALFTSNRWGTVLSIQIFKVNYAGSEPSATFKLNGSLDVTLLKGQVKTW